MQSLKFHKIGLSFLKGDRIDWSSQNLACKHRLEACSSVPNLALIGNEGARPLKLANLVKFVRLCVISLKFVMEKDG